MQHLTILNSKEIKALRETLLQQFGYALPKNYGYLENEKHRVFIINTEAGKIEWNKFLVDKVGLYFGEIMHDRQFRLSKEGTQLLALEARKQHQELRNVISLDTVQVQQYFLGNDLELDLGPEARFVILRYKTDVLGCARYKESKILNFLPKNHRGEVIL